MNRMNARTTSRKLRFLHTIFAMERDLIVGGQAVMEGVMMRTPSAYAIACRKSDGEIVTTAESLPKWSDKYKWLSWPVLRGGATLIQSMALGIKALNFSARIYEEDQKVQEELAKEKALETQAVLADGVDDEAFLKAPVKVVMPEKKEEPKAKKVTQSASAVGSIIFALGFNILLFIVAPLVLDEPALYRPRLGRGSGRRCRCRLVGNHQAVCVEDQAPFIRHVGFVQSDRRADPDGVFHHHDLLDVVFEGHPPRVRVSRRRAQDRVYLGKRPRPDAGECHIAATAASAMRNVVPDGRYAGRDRAVFGHQF